METPFESPTGSSQRGTDHPLGLNLLPANRYYVGDFCFHSTRFIYFDLGAFHRGFKF